MTKQALFYETVVPLSVQRHRNWALETGTNYEFAEHTNSVPLAAAEFSAAAAEYVIVFVGTGEAVNPAVILGLEPDENLYIKEHGQWSASYIPAFVRRYPFVFSENKAEGKFTLCIDEKYTGWNQEGHGQGLFDSNAERTDYLNKTLKFLQDYQVQSSHTQAFCQKLHRLDLLKPMTARFELPSGNKAALTGFMAVDREQLNALPDEKLAELARSGELELIYIHLQSMRNIASMAARVPVKDARNTIGGEAVVSAPDDDKRDSDVISTEAADDYEPAGAGAATVGEDANDDSIEGANNEEKKSGWWEKLGKRIH